MTEPSTPPARHVRAAFGRAAATYDDAARVQREICADLLTLAHQHAPGTTERFLDAGCGTGRGAAEALAWLHPTETFALDFAPEMLARCDAARWHHRLCADLQAIPLPNASVDVIWSSLAVQWCAPDRALAEMARILRPGGRAFVATLGPGTLHELRHAFAAVDDARHVIAFHPAATWGDSATAAGLTVDALKLQPRAATAPDLRRLLRDIKAIGAHAVGDGRRRTPLGKAAWRTLQARYEPFRRTDGLLPATYDVILLALRKPQ
ncbi:malonyl-ACP O-methyltransferase BioC [Nitrogeniibacter mangrovi]|uniref:malonyl-[acyl-carrier protein] O-methyltransferase n=1 Tax=Nitrogeniibacter mangrovi TaxID=2016596 RepID=A0A6C1B6Z0_9RHOO|nr:malonyl-ACP O-methyltransferase BioC [Nitrogeniibacter mangrovi]QID18014.1 malonyl-ACP O-methyltransferase BioC [Nitrogeniibacter mangrovi]